MRYLVLRNEKSVSEVIDRAYDDLTKKSRDKLEKDILKLNPELKSFEATHKGAILRVPEIFKDGKKNSKNLEDPVESVAHLFIEQLETMEKVFDRKFSEQDKLDGESMEILKAAADQLKAIPGGEEASKTLAQSLKQDKKQRDKNYKLGQKALKALLETAASFDR